MYAKFFGPVASGDRRASTWVNCIRCLSESHLTRWMQSASSTCAPFPAIIECQIRGTQAARCSCVSPEVDARPAWPQKITYPNEIKRSL